MAPRSALAKLCSGYCKALNTFQNRQNINPACPACSSGDLHTTNHLFNCPAYPTELAVRNLCIRPDLVASHISPSLSSSISLLFTHPRRSHLRRDLRYYPAPLPLPARKKCSAVKCSVMKCRVVKSSSV